MGASSENVPAVSWAENSGNPTEQVAKRPGDLMEAWLSEYLMANDLSCWHVPSTAKLSTSPNPGTGLTLPMSELTDSPGPPPSQMRK